MTDVIRYGFVAGEISESYYGRADLEKYDLALAEAENWYVNYQGGLSNVPGTTYVDFIDQATLGFRFFPFKFSDTIANKYLVLFGPGYIRFIQDGSYVLEAAKVVEAFGGGTTSTISIVGHGFSTGDLIQVITPGNLTGLANQTYKITVLSADNFQIKNAFSEDIDTSTYPSYTSGMTIGRVYTVTHSYANNHLNALKISQVRDVLRITHPDYKIMNLRRYAHANWTLTQETFVKTVNAPGKPTCTETHDTASSPAPLAQFNVGYVVSAVDAEGNESLPSDLGVQNGTTDSQSANTGSVTLNWTGVDNVDYYNIYRTRYVYSSPINRMYQLGYIGRSRGPRFTDSGITPDFTKTPLKNVNPFARKGIKYINVVSDGSGINNLATMTVTDSTGSGFIGYPIVLDNKVVGFNILDGGENYTAPTITLSSGTGYSFTVELTDAADVDPSVSTVYQQRQIYAGTRNRPLTVFGSRPGKLSDFAVSDVQVADDAFSHEIDSENFSSIRHLIPTRGGIIVMSSGGIWLMSGSNSGAITATDVQADANVYTGAADLSPLRIDTDLLYLSTTGGRVNSLAYTDQSKLYAPQDVSILANHLLTPHTIYRWAYADEPYRMIFGVRTDGVMLLFTRIKDQEVYAWTRRITNGYYKDVLTLEGDGTTDIYFAVMRYIKNQWVTYIERMVTEKPASVDDAVYLDCSLSLGKTYPTATLTLDAATGENVAASLNVSYFNTSHVGQILRFGKGKARVIAVVSGTLATVQVLTDFDRLQNYSTKPELALTGEWTLDPEYTTVTNLYHLEGQTVTALADGNVYQNLVVTNGVVTLPQAASRVTVGIPYKSIAKNLPLTVNGAVVEGKRKRVTSMALRVLDTRGLKVGANLNELYQMRTQLAQTLGISSPLYSGITHVTIEPIWSEDAQHYLVQEYPLPATILGYIMETDVGDG